MLGRTYDREICSAARALEVAGERWSLLILRNAAFAAMTRFTDFQQRLGIAPNVLTARLDHFVAEGLMEAIAGSSGFPEYHLTEKGRDFVPVLVALTEWGDRWEASDGAPIRYDHEGCGGRVRMELACDGCAEIVPPAEVVARPTAAMARAQARRQAGKGKGARSR